MARRFWTREELLYIRNVDKTYRELAKEMGTSDVTIGKIRTGRSYPNVTSSAIEAYQAANSCLQWESKARAKDEVPAPCLCLVRDQDLETWAAVRGQPRLLVSSHGRAWSHQKHALLSPATRPCGYKLVSFQDEGRRQTLYLHRLVAEAFLEASFGQTEVNHIVVNGKVDKGDNFYKHLEWATPAENRADAQRNRLHAFGERNGMARLTREQIKEIRSSSESTKTLSERFNVKTNTITRIRARQRWQLLE